MEADEEVISATAMAEIVGAVVSAGSDGHVDKKSIRPACVKILRQREGVKLPVSAMND